MTATQREGLSDAALALTQPVIDELLKDIARRIKDAGAITDTAEYQIYRAQALGESKQAIKAAVARQIKAQDKVIDSLFDYILDNSTPLTANGSLKQIAEGYAKMSRQKTAEQLKNLWADTPQGKVLPIQDAYAKALDFAFRQTVTGALDTETAIRRACAPLAKRGLRTIEQKSGRSVGIEYACRRYLMDQLGELDDEVQQVTYAVHTDYRDILDIIDHLQNTDDNEQERWYIAMALFYENWRDIPAQNRQEAAERMAEFIACGKTQGKPGAKREIDWQQDAELIVGGVNKVAGCEVRALPYLHWWTFIAYFMNIGSGPLATVVGIRHKLAKGQKLEKWEQQFYRENKEIVDLRPQLTKEEEAEKQRLLALLGEA